MTADDLPGFLLARIAEDEATARNASPAAWTYDRETFTVRSGQWEVASRRRSTYPGDPHHATTPIMDVDGTHIARHDPARVLADCAAKRAMIQAWPDPMGQWTAAQADAARAMKRQILLAWARAYAGHADFDPSWARDDG